jgi:hypothetical protein
MRFYWRNTNRGVTITDAGRKSCLAWRAEGHDISRLWTDIIAVNMLSASDGNSAVNHCRIRFRDGRVITVTDADARGQVDENRTPVYRDFIRALHARLAHAPAGAISFFAGVPEGRHMMQVAVLMIVGLLFTGVPLVLGFVVRDWRVLGALAIGVAFIWPFWKIVERNRPRRYDPRHPPGELME